MAFYKLKNFTKKLFMLFLKLYSFEKAKDSVGDYLILKSADILKL
jgi:hypothetical protein